MEIIEYILYGMVIFCFVAAIAVFVSFFVTCFIDWRHNRKYGAWEELKRTNYERRRPAAK